MQNALNGGGTPWLSKEQQLALSSLFAWLFASAEERERVCQQASMRLEPTAASLPPDKYWAGVFGAMAASPSGISDLKRLLRAGMVPYPDQPGLSAFLTLADVLEAHGADVVYGLKPAPQTAPPLEPVVKSPPASAPTPVVLPATEPQPVSSPVGAPVAPQVASTGVRKAPPARPTHVRPIKLFFVCTESDRATFQPLEALLRASLEAGELKSIHQRVLGDPSQWRRKVSSQLEQADVVVWAVSRTFLGSEYLHEDEADWTLEMARRGQARLVVVEMGECAWRERIKGKVAVFPREGGPLAGRSDTEDACEAILEGILLVAEEVKYR